MDAAKALHYRMMEGSNPNEVVVAEALSMEFALRSGEVARCVPWFESFDCSNPGVPFLYPGRSLIYLRAALEFATPESLTKAREVLKLLFAKVGDSCCPADEVDIRILRALLHQAEGNRQ